MFFFHRAKVGREREKPRGAGGVRIAAPSFPAFRDGCERFGAKLGAQALVLVKGESIFLKLWATKVFSETWGFISILVLLSFQRGKFIQLTRTLQPESLP